jgi:putative DNA-invertase from lambdoid prophage Rac
MADKSPTHTRAALYARVSTLKGQDVELQLRELRELAARMGWQTTEFTDEGQSGRKCSRPAFDKLMDGVRRRRFDIVCVWRLDRLSRGLRHAVNVLGEFRDLGVEFVSVRDGLNFSGPLGMALYALVAALAEAEVEALRERTVAGLKNARAKGKRLGRPPLGHASIEQILALKQRGVSQEQIAKSLGVSTAFVSRSLHPYKSCPAAAS